MANDTSERAAPMARVYSVPTGSRIVGSGLGTVLIEILRWNRTLSHVLNERLGMLELARKDIAAAGLTHHTLVSSKWKYSNDFPSAPTSTSILPGAT
jgi:hypothetical protein